jgi:hypothetical protein
LEFVLQFSEKIKADIENKVVTDFLVEKEDKSIQEFFYVNLLLMHENKVF